MEKENKNSLICSLGTLKCTRYFQLHCLLHYCGARTNLEGL